MTTIRQIVAPRGGVDERFAGYDIVVEAVPGIRRVPGVT